MRSVLVVTAVLAGVMGIGAAAAPAPPSAEPPPGAQISDSLEYIGRIPGTSQVVEGKFDKVGGREILILTGRFGFKTLDVTDPTSPRALDTFLPAEGPGLHQIAVGPVHAGTIEPGHFRFNANGETVVRVEEHSVAVDRVDSRSVPRPGG